MLKLECVRAECKEIEYNYGGSEVIYEPAMTDQSAQQSYQAPCFELFSKFFIEDSARGPCFSLGGQGRTTHLHGELVST